MEVEKSQSRNEGELKSGEATEVSDYRAHLQVAFS